MLVAGRVGLNKKLNLIWLATSETSPVVQRLGYLAFTSTLRVIAPRWSGFDSPLRKTLLFAGIECLYSSYCRPSAVIGMFVNPSHCLLLSFSSLYGLQEAVWPISVLRHSGRRSSTHSLTLPSCPSDRRIAPASSKADLSSACICPFKLPATLSSQTLIYRAILCCEPTKSNKAVSFQAHSRYHQAFGNHNPFVHRDVGFLKHLHVSNRQDEVLHDGNLDRKPRNLYIHLQYPEWSAFVS